MTKTRIRGVFIFMGMLTALAVAFALGLDGYMRTGHGQRFVLDAISNSIPGTLSCRQLHSSVLRGKLEIAAGVLADPEGKQVVRAGDLAVNISWLSLLKGDVVIEEATIENPFLDFSLDREENLRIVRAVYQGASDESSEEDQGTGFVRNIIVKQLSLTNGSVHYEDSDGSVQADISGIQLAANGDLSAQELNFQGQFTRASYAGKDMHAGLQKFFAQTSFRKDVFDPVIIQAGTGFSSISIRGAIADILERPRFDLNADVVISLSELRDAFSLSPDLTGQLSAGIILKGNLDDPEVFVHLDYGGGVLGWRQVKAAEIDLGLKDMVVTLEKAHLAAASGNILVQGSADLSKAFPDGLLSENRDPEEITYTLSAEGTGLDLAELLPEETSMKGIAAPTITLTGTGISPEKIRVLMSAEMVCRDMLINEAGSPVDISMKYSARIEDSVVWIHDLEAISGINTLAGAGWLDLSSRELDIRMELDVPDLKEELEPFGIGGGGRIWLVAHVSKTLDAPQIQVDLSGKKIRYNKIALGDIVCTAGLDPSGMLKITRFALENRGSKIQGAGSVRMYEKFPEFTTDGPVSFTAALSDIEVQDFITSPDIDGTWAGEVVITGTISFPDARLTLDGNGVSTGGVRIGGMEVRSTLKKGTLFLEKILARNRNSTLLAEGTIKVFDPDRHAYLKDPPLRIALKGDGIFLEDIHQGYAGKLSVQGRVEGSIRHPEGLLNLSGEELDLGFQKIHRAVLASRIDNERFVVDELSVFLSEDEMIAGSGWVSLQKEYAFHLASRQIFLQSIHALEGNKAAQGMVRLDLSGQGSLDNPSLKGRAALTGLVMQENAPGEMAVTIDLKDHEARISGNLDFEFSGSYHLDEKEFSFLAVFDHTDISPYFVLGGMPDLKGRADGRIKAEGNMQGSRDLQALIEVTHLDIFFRDSEIVRSDGLKATITGTSVSIPQTRIILGHHGWVDINGTGKLGGGFVLNASGDIPLQVMEPFVQHIEDIEGRVLFTAQLEDSGKKAEIQSDITLQGIGMKVPYIEEQLHDTSGHITITSQMVLFEKIDGSLGDGGFNLAGKMELKDLVPERLGFRLRARSLPVGIPDTMDLFADLDLRLEGTPEESLMQGEAVLLEGTYYRDIKLNLMEGLRTIVEKKPQVKSSRKQITMPFFKNMEVDISVKRRNPLYVDNNLALLDINPDLTITGTLNNPVINGRATVESGTIEFRNRTFNVTRGVVDFLNPYQTEATIDLESGVTIRDWTIYLEVAGTPDALNLSLRSDPEEEDNDILSLIVLGKTSRELISGEGGSTQSTSAMIATLVASRYGEDIKEATGLDILEIESEADQEDSAETVKLTIGKELSRRITLKYAMESKNSELSQRAVAEYKLLENILVN
ncbi:MAG: translocation/assembly module TamB domain-containing protein, partial [Deltaproteobacteria bacterium]|nr:translocation/assembly module TamB domain-containing protein [Deltaproteobacteria bacterium]